MKKLFRVGDKIVPNGDIRTVRKVEKDGVWTGVHKDWMAFWCFETVTLVRRAAKRQRRGGK